MIYVLLVCISFAATQRVSSMMIHRPASAYYNETLIKNITQLLDTLLDNYDAKLRPGHGEHPLTVKISISVRSFGAISEKDMIYSVDCYFRQAWLDERLKFQGSGSLSKLSLAPKVLKDIWRPDTYIKNGLQSYLHKLTMPNILLRVSENGDVYVSQRLTIVARCPMHLSKFPMDAQACPLIIGSLGYSQKDLRYEWVAEDALTIEWENGTELAQYQLSQVITAAGDDSDIRGAEYGETNVLVTQQGYYILQIYLPCTLIVVMSWVSFWINKEASPARVALGIMTVLNMSTVSYSTALDIYFFACFGFVFMALVEYAVINFANIVYLRHTVHRMRMFAGQMMGATTDHIAGTELDVFTNAERRRSTAADGDGQQSVTGWRRFLPCRRKQKDSMFVRMAKKAAKTRQKLQGKDPSKTVDKIDQFAKVIFPLTYVVFNLLYWVTYLYWLPDEIETYRLLRNKINE